MIKKIATSIWNISEFCNVPLGFFASYIFALMIDSTLKKTKEERRR